MFSVSKSVSSAFLVLNLFLPLIVFADSPMMRPVELTPEQEKIKELEVKCAQLSELYQGALASLGTAIHGNEENPYFARQLRLSLVENALNGILVTGIPNGPNTDLALKHWMTVLQSTDTYFDDQFKKIAALLMQIQSPGPWRWENAFKLHLAAYYKRFEDTEKEFEVIDQVLTGAVNNGAVNHDLSFEGMLRRVFGLFIFASKSKSDTYLSVASGKDSRLVKLFENLLMRDQPRLIQLMRRWNIPNIHFQPAHGQYIEISLQDDSKLTARLVKTVPVTKYFPAVPMTVENAAQVFLDLKAQAMTDYYDLARKAKLNLFSVSRDAYASLRDLSSELSIDVLGERKVIRISSPDKNHNGYQLEVPINDRAELNDNNEAKAVFAALVESYEKVRSRIKNVPPLVSYRSYHYPFVTGTVHGLLTWRYGRNVLILEFAIDGSEPTIKDPIALAQKHANEYAPLNFLEALVQEHKLLLGLERVDLGYGGGD